MDDSDQWDAVLALGASVAEEVGLKVQQAGPPVGDDLYVLASALAWVVLRRAGAGEREEVLERWHKDIPDALHRYARRLGVRSPA